METGELAQQANGSVLVRYGDNVLLVTATMGKPREGIDFFPLTVDFEERLYARGKVPGSFFRREGRPSTHATLISRLTDRPIRPLFPKGFRNEIQIIITPLSTDLESPFDVLAIMGASAALSISDIPFEGPISATRVGYVGGELVVNPAYAQLEESALDLVVVGSSHGILMMQAGAREVSENLVLEAIERAQEINLEGIAFQEEIAASVGKPKTSFQVQSPPQELEERVADLSRGEWGALLDASTPKAEQGTRTQELRARLVEELGEQHESRDILNAFNAVMEREFRRRILAGDSRPDGRRPRDIRPLSSKVAVLPRTHGTGLFTRGETQILGVATLGSIRDAQKLDTLSPEESNRFLVHYNFPPYSTGETKRVGSPGRREIGHGALAERALIPVIPSEEEFPYTIRLVCEALSSNGSTSMASVCAGTLALMDAGVPIKTPIAGISIGLITGEGGEYVILTDIQGLEDHMGDMDFKVAGSEQGLTAIQLDIKVKSIGLDIIKDALAQGREANLVLLDHMEQTLGAVRADLSPYAPRMVKISIPVDKIGALIGPGGKTIRGIIEQTKATVDVQDDGTVVVGSADGEASKKAIEMIENLTREAKVGEIYTGKVVRIMDFGAFVEILPGKDGLVHISELANYHVPKVEDEVNLGDEITVMVKEIDAMGRINLSRRALLQGPSESQDGTDNGEPVSTASGAPRAPRPAQGRPSHPGGRPQGDRSGYRPRGPRHGGDRRGYRGGSGSSGPRPDRSAGDRGP